MYTVCTLFSTKRMVRGVCDKTIRPLAHQFSGRGEGVAETGPGSRTTWIVTHTKYHKRGLVRIHLKSRQSCDRIIYPETRFGAMDERYRLRAQKRSEGTFWGQRNHVAGQGQGGCNHRDVVCWNLSGRTRSTSPPAHRIDEAGGLGRSTGPVVALKDEQGNMD